MPARRRVLHRPEEDHTVTPQELEAAIDELILKSKLAATDVADVLEAMLLRYNEQAAEDTDTDA
jgi:hypothetical protein